MLDFLESQGSLEEFLKRHIKPYDPASDDYDRPPFAADIKEGKNDSIYNAHSYHTKVPPRSIIPYILHYTKPGDLVLDLFCGSGMTGVAAQMCANPPADLLEQFPELKDRVGPRACILNDLSPAACHIAYNYNTPVDVNALKKEFERIEAAVKDEFDWLYGTEHYEPAIGDYALTIPEVLTRLRNPPPDIRQYHAPSTFLLEEGEEVPKTWTLLNRSEVEQRLGYPVSDLPRDQGWKDIDVSQVEEWICIPATIQYTIWSDVYRCEGLVTIEEATGKVSTRGKNVGKPIVTKKRVPRGCGKGIVLWDAAVDQKTREVREIFTCPHCGLIWKKIQIQREPAIPVKVNIEYDGLRSRNGKTRVFTQTLMRPVVQRERNLMVEINVSQLKVWVPSVRFDKNGPQYRRNALSARNIDYITDLFTCRNLRALALLWEGIGKVQDVRLRSAYTFAFTAIITRSSWLNRLRPSGAGDPQTGTIYIASLTREENVFRLFEGRFNRHLKSFGIARSSQCIVLNESACSLPRISDASIDYVFTDPPFGSNIYYSEPNLIWEAWLGKITDPTEEAVVHRKNDGGTKRLPDYARLMKAAFNEMFRVLKPNRWATVEFNNSDGAVFEVIKQAIRQAGFEIVNMLLLDKEQRTFKQVKGAEGIEDVVDKDVLFNLYKPAVIRIETRGEEHDLGQQVADAVRQHLQTLPERIKADPARYSDDHRTTATINSMLMNVLIPRGVSVERLNLPYIERLCSRYFRKIGQHWYLRGEAVNGSKGSNGGLMLEEIAVKEEVSAIDWLRQKVQARPMLVGELKPLWMRATGLLPAEVSQQLDLEVLLRENFWKDAESNRWREPTEEERELMNDSQTLRVLHDAERFLAGSLKRQVSDTDRCEWIEAIFRACRAVEEQEGEELPALRDFDPGAGYRMISQLFQGVLSDHVPAAVFGRVEKQARVASSRLREGFEPDNTGKKSQESKNQLELEL
ncbi:MAG: site-specific DNA-methyltransferase [Proteobacteria bacterium]|nr:site-specific DNA-methyltransferase [Pseudomonadota bacterium]